MSEEKHEALSALVDGELSAEDGPRLLDQVLEDLSLKRRWSTYHLIGDVMRKHVIDQQALSGRIDCIEGAAPPEPVADPRRRGELSPLAGLALAASVALVAGVGIFALSDTKNGPVEMAQESPGVQATADGGPEPSSVVAGALGIDLARMTWNDEAPAVTNRLNGYLVTHNEYLSNEMRGMLPYARIVAYDDGQN
ncbi:MAG TPA: sigma-E factor negative regulatory protein [Gammaproteobacteria bacterium]|nr:sigma-E factor negative regulatory protein [Gammaproteobacteria bacterium]